MSDHVALLCGASGLVGQDCLRILRAHPDYRLLRIVTRRDLGLAHEGGLEQVIVDFDNLADAAELLQANHVFCAFGTTMSKAGSRERFRRIDLEYPRELAAIARANGARHICLVSAIGAEPRSSVFYSRVKGELEQAVGAQGWPGVTVFRPSVIEGPRREFRPGERLGRWLMRWGPRKYRPVTSHAIAMAMVNCALRGKPGFETVESQEIGGAGGIVQPLDSSRVWS